MSGGSSVQQEAADTAEAAKALADLLDRVDHTQTTVRHLQRALEAQLGRHVPRQWIRSQVDQGLRSSGAVAETRGQEVESRGRPRVAQSPLAGEARRAPADITLSLSKKDERAASSRLHRLYKRHEKLRQRRGEEAFISRSVLHSLHDSLSALPRGRGTLKKVCRELKRRYASIAAALPAPLDVSVRHALESSPGWFVPIPPKAEGKKERFAAAQLDAIAVNG
jgi:hypothetical protein